MTFQSKVILINFQYNGRPIEKGVLRKACDRDDLLPKSVLWRQKEQFSGFTFLFFCLRSN